MHNFLRVLAGALAMPGHSKLSLRCCCRTPLRQHPCHDWHPGFWSALQKPGCQLLQASLTLLCCADQHPSEMVPASRRLRPSSESNVLVCNLCYEAKASAFEKVPCANQQAIKHRYSFHSQPTLPLCRCT